MFKLIISLLVLLIPLLGLSQRAKLYYGLPNKTYYKNGSLRVERNFDEGKFLGYKTFYKNGVLKSNYVFNSKGFHDSIANFYYPNGEVKTVWQYKKGVVKKRTNYTLEGKIVKGEKKYRLIKECNMALAFERNNLSLMYKRGKLNSQLGFHDEALEDFNYILSKIDLSSLNHLAERSIYHNIAISYSNIEDYEKSLMYNFKALALQPDNQAVLNNIGSLLLWNQDYNLALEYLDKCHKINPNNYYAFANKARLYLETGNYTKALNFIEKTIADERSHKLSEKNISEEKTIWVIRGELYYKFGRYEEGIKDLEKALEENPVNSYAYRCLAKIYISKNQSDKACNALAKASEYKHDKIYDTDEVKKLLNEYCSQN